MKRIHSAADEAALEKGFVVDTTFVLFFLGLEFGRSLTFFAFDGFLLGMTLLMVLILPFFFGANIEFKEFGRWITGRSLVAVFATLLGTGYGWITGSMVPDSFKYLPMTLLIVAATASCCAQFYGLTKLRPAK